MTNVRWTANDSHLVSVGGGDTAVMLWQHLGVGETKGDSDDSGTDSEEEGGYDSDVAREKNIDYSTKTYANPIRSTAGIKPYEQEYDEDDG